MQLLKDIIYTILSYQEKFLKFRLEKTINAKQTSKRKKHFGVGCTIDLNTLADEEKQQLEDELTLILKNCDFEPEKILNYVKSQGTKVYRLKNSAKILNSIGENEGFIYPMIGAKALYISLMTENKIKFKTDEMFIVPNENINKYYFIYHLYKWFAFRHGISGLDNEAQRLLKDFLFSDGNSKELQLEDIYKLKDAIKQDKSAIEFVIKLCRNTDGAKQALEKMKSNGSAKL